MPQLEGPDIYLTNSGWRNPPNEGDEELGSLRIKVRLTSDKCDILSIDYIMRDLEGNIIGSINSELVSQISEQLEDEDPESQSTHWEEKKSQSNGLFSKLRFFISSMEREEMASLISPCSLILREEARYQSTDLELQLIRLFTAEVSFYLVVLDLMYKGVELIPISFDMAHEGLDARSLTRSALHYYSIAFETVRLIGNCFGSECGWMIVNFCNGWGCLLIEGDNLRTEKLALSIINSSVAATIERLNNQNSKLMAPHQENINRLQHQIRDQKLQIQQQQFRIENLLRMQSNMESRISQLEHRISTISIGGYGHKWQVVETGTTSTIEKSQSRQTSTESTTFKSSGSNTETQTLSGLEQRTNYSDSSRPSTYDRESLLSETSDLYSSNLDASLVVVDVQSLGSKSTSSAAGDGSYTANNSNFSSLNLSSSSFRLTRSRSETDISRNIESRDVTTPESSLLDLDFHNPLYNHETGDSNNSTTLDLESTVKFKPSKNRHRYQQLVPRIAKSQHSEVWCEDLADDSWNSGRN